jgi:plastocyanin
VRRWRGIGRQSRRGGTSGAWAPGEQAAGERAGGARVVGKRATGARAHRTGAATLALVCAAATALAAGCGSSESGGGSNTSAANGSASSASSTSTNGKPKEGIVPNGKINYASPSPNAPVQSGTVKIKYHEITIEPDTLRVKVGSTIEWVNEDPVEHNVTSEPGAPSKLSSGNFGEGHTFRFIVTKPGIIHYKCTNHPATMNGTIEVVS